MIRVCFNQNLCNVSHSVRATHILWLPLCARDQWLITVICAHGAMITHIMRYLQYGTSLHKCCNGHVISGAMIRYIGFMFYKRCAPSMDMSPARESNPRYIYIIYNETFVAQHGRSRIVNVRGRTNGNVTF
jgi:hypothetical protein